VVTCNLDDLAAGELVTTTILVDVISTTRGAINNVAELSSDNDSTNNNNRASARTTVSAPGRAENDLLITVQDIPDPVQAGGRLRYLVTVLNLGPTQASGIVISNTLPLNVTLVETNLTGDGTCQPSDNTIICFLNTRLARDESTTLEIVVDVNEDATGTLINLAQVVSGGFDPQLENNAQVTLTSIGTATGSVTETVDLVLTKQDEPDPVQAGTSLSYTLTIENSGSISATNVAIKDSLPLSVTFLEALPTFQGSCELSDISDNTVICLLDEPLPPDTSTSVAIGVEVDALATGSLINQAEVTSDVPDSQPSNNIQVELTRIVLDQPGETTDLALSKQAATDTVQAGDRLTYTITVDNNGPADGSGIIVEDLLPEGVAFVSALASQGRYTLVENTVVWFLSDPLASDSSANIEIIVQVDDDVTDTLINEAEVSSDGEDTQLTNNTDSVQTNIETDNNNNTDIMSIYLPLVIR
jgi:uncharacterized repeat protein (TIGR01451 family)